MRRNKFGAKRTEYLGETWDSRAEANVASILVLRKHAGDIHRWTRGEKQTLIHGPSRSRTITYKPDFMVWKTEHGPAEAWDVKGVVGREFRIKAILWEQKFPNIPLKVVDKNGNEKWRLK